MKEKVLIFWFMLLSCIPVLLRGQEAEAGQVTTRNVSYIVIKGDKLKNVAVRFQVAVKTLKKINKLSSGNFTVYPGMVLQVPVKVRPHIWDPSKEDITDAASLSQDRLPSVEYEIISEGFDYDIRDDFITQADAYDDSVQYERIGVHMYKIDKRVSLLTYRMDSLKQTEFAFQSDTDLNSVLGRMQIARESYYTNGPIGKSIDSLNRVKAQLGNLRIRLRNKKTEYDYLTENAAYAKENYERDEKSKDTHWGDQITYESNYARSLARHNEILKEDTAARARVDSMKPKAAPAIKDTIAVQPLVISPTPPVKDTTPTPVAITPVPETKDKASAAAPVVIVQDAAPTTKPTVVEKPIPEPVVVKQTETKPVVMKETAPDPVPMATISKSNSPFGINQKMDISPLSVKRVPAPIHYFYLKPELVSLPAEPKMAIPLFERVDTTKSAKTNVIKATIDTPVKIKTVQAITDTVKNAIPARTAVKADTVIRTAIAATKSDTVVPKVSDTLSKTMIPAIDTTAKVGVVPVAKPIVNTTTYIATTATDTIKPKAAMAKIDTVFKTAILNNSISSRTIVDVPKGNNQDATVKPESGIVSKDTVIQTKMTTAALDTPAKPAIIAALKDTTSKTNPVVTPISTKTKTTPSTYIDVKDNDSEDAVTRTAKGKGVKTARESTKPDHGKEDTDDDNGTNSETTKGAKVKANKIDTIPALIRVQSKDVNGTSSTNITENGGPLGSIDTKYDSAMLVREKAVNMDPLASYKTDSNFITNTIQLKEIPILEYKNKPKYLIAVDSVSQIKAEFYLIRARQVLEKGDFKEGDKFLRKSLELNPNSAATWMLHADLALTMGAVDKALKEYSISGEIDSTNPKVFYNIALLYSKANDEQKAYKFFSKATDVNDKYLLAYMGRATVLMDQRDYEGAIQDYDKTLSINKYYSPAYKGRALAKMEARHFEDAVTDFNQYLEIEDPDGYILYERGIAKILSNNLLQGCLDLSSSLELGFKDAEKAIKKFCE